MKSSFIRSPMLNSSGNESTVKFEATTDSAANAVPAVFKGQFVSVKAVGGNLHYFFTTDSTATCDRSVSATAAGASGATVGDYLANGDQEYVAVPDSAGPVYFVREADATTVVYMRRCG